MQWIISFIQDIINSFSGVLNLLKSIGLGLVKLAISLPQYIAQLTTCVGFLPEQLITWFSIGITVTVIFIILGRRDGGD